MKTISQIEFLRVLEEESPEWPPFTATYGNKTWIHVRVALDGESDLLFRTEVQA